MIHLSYFKFRMCEKVGGLGGTPRNTSTKLLFSLYFIYYHISFLILFSSEVSRVRKGWGSGGNPQKYRLQLLFSLCFVNYDICQCFLFHFWKVLNDCVFLISFIYIFCFLIFIFHFIILLHNKDYNSSYICSPITSG